MTISAHIGWWLLPLVFTLAGLVWAIPVRADERRHGDYSFTGLESLIRTAGVVILALAVWLAWALIA